jgi:CubicO group peptidase (beta-lactamase class C family)
MNKPVEAHGLVTAGFEGVVEEFERNFSEREELGAAFAVYRDGRLVIDIWGGIAHRPAMSPWARDTVQMIFSGTKGLVAVCLLALIERGELELHAPVARYWPEFADTGKGEILVEQVVSHRSGLPGLSDRVEMADLLDDRRLSALLAAQEPLLAPGTFCYHPLTFGWLCGELVRRITGRSIGSFFETEVASPLGLELWIGLPSEQETRVATLELEPAWNSSGSLEAALARDQLARLAWANPPCFDADVFPFNAPEYHAAEIPGVSGIGTARSLARVYGCLACDGQIEGVRLLKEETVALGRTELSRDLDPVAGREMAFGVGFALPTDLVGYGPPADAFGHRGAGGSMHGAWPSERVGFSDGTNLMLNRVNDPRAEALLLALHKSVSALG